MTYADTIVYYSSTSGIRGINLDTGAERLYTTSPYTASVNAVAVNGTNGFVYYGSGSDVYYWNPTEGTGATAHHLMNNVAASPLNLPIGFLNSGGGTYGNGKYYVAAEDSTGFVTDIFALTLSADGQQVVAGSGVGLLAACGCSGTQLGGLGDIAVVDEGSAGVIYGATTDITAGSGSHAGRWKFDLGSGVFTLLSNGAGGQMSSNPAGDVFITQGNNFHTFNKSTGQPGAVVATTPVLPYDTSAGVTLDYGDAPATYGIAQHARSTLSDVIRLGSIAPDNELMPSTVATPGLDDDVNGDDEDAIANMPDLLTDQNNYTVTLDCRGSAVVSGWLDYSNNGRFSNTERNSNHPVSCTNNSVFLEWNNLPSLTAGSTYARFRTGSDVSQIAQPTGHAIDGEVEDYLVKITSPPVASCPAGHESLVYHATNTPQSIGPNRGWTFSTLTVPDDVQVTDVNIIDIKGTHSQMSDLIFYFWRDNTYTRLFGYSCGNDDNFSFGFDDEAASPPSCPPTDGQLHKPYDSIAKYDNLSSQANWSLGIYDRRNGEGGELQSWGVELCYAPENPAPVVGLAKQASVSGREVTFEITVENLGESELRDISLSDDLDTVFGATNYSVLVAPSVISGAASLVLNPDFTGSASSSLIVEPASGSTLAVGAKSVISFVVNVDVLGDQGNGIGDYANQATVNAVDEFGSATADLSDNGSVADSDEDGNPNEADENDPTPISLQPVIFVHGSVFVDNGEGGVAQHAHNGQMDAAEQGLGAIEVRATEDQNSGNVIATTVTSADGSYRLEIPFDRIGSSIFVSTAAGENTIAISENISNPAMLAGATTDASASVQMATAESIFGIDFGRIKPPQMDPDHDVTASAGSTVVHAHVFRSFTAGVVGFSIESPVATPVTDSWSTTLHRDVNCNSELDQSDSPLSGPVTVDSATASICLLAKTFVPATASSGARYHYSIEGVMEYADAHNMQHALSSLVGDEDITRVAESAAGELRLTKTVENLTRLTGQRVSNDAEPGDQLKYSIKFENTGAAAISDVTINDTTPAYTELAGGIDCPGNLPGTLAGCSLTSPASAVNSAGYTGDIRWSFDGALAPGASGWVEYIVVIE